LERFSKSLTDDEVRCRSLALAAVVFFGLVSVLEQIRLIRGLTSRYTTEDQVLLWAAARDVSHFAFNEPTFYGQGYGSILEALPIGLVHSLGISFSVAVPVVLTFAFLAGWWLVAFAAFKRGWLVAAVIAAAAPILLSSDHAVLAGVYGTAAGRFLAAVALAAVIGFETSAAAGALALGLGGLAVAIDASAALVAIPALLWAVPTWWRSRQCRRIVPIGLVLPLGWWLLITLFNRSHPDHLLHPAPRFTPELSILRQQLENPGRLLDTHAPELLRNGLVLVGALIVALAALAILRAWRGLVAGSAFLALTLLLASVPRSLDGFDTVWFRPARISLAVPMGLWFICALSLDAASSRLRGDRRRRPLAVGAIAIVVVLALLTSAVRVATFHSRIGELETQALAQPLYAIRDPGTIVETCRAAASAASRVHTRLVAFASDRTLAYACAAETPSISTVYPTYERRTWVLHEWADERTDKLIVWQEQPSDCAPLIRVGKVRSCRSVADGAGVVVRFPKSAPLDILNELGYQPRPFGPGCHPQEPATCSAWAGRFGAR
jgi:hypothetical protein